MFTLLVGSLQTARAVTDPELSDRILASAYAHAMTIASPHSQPAHAVGQDSA